MPATVAGRVPVLGRLANMHANTQVDRNGIELVVLANAATPKMTAWNRRRYGAGVVGLGT
jgi:hypothetical protein